MARAAPADYREYIKLAVDLPANPKLALIDNPAAGWAYVVSLCYCGQHLTDGSFPMTPLLRLAGVKNSIAKLLIAAELWHEAGHTCDRCPQPMAGTGIVHDYLLHQRSSGEAKALRDARREAGRKGAASRWDGTGDGKSHSNGHGKSHANGEASGMADASQTDASPMAEVEEEKEQKKTPSSSSATAPPSRDDVDQLVARLRESMIANDFKIPTSFEDWRRHARLLLDRDNRELGQALRLIDWATGHHFWMGNIRSMGKFRTQYDALLVQARNEYRQQQTGSPPQPDRITGWQALKQTGTDNGRAPQLRALPGGDHPC